MRHVFDKIDYNNLKIGDIFEYFGEIVKVSDIIKNEFGMRIFITDGDKND